MTHYVCDSCGGVSDISKSCSTEGCVRAGQPLRECTCDNPEHTARAESAKKEREQNK